MFYTRGCPLTKVVEGAPLTACMHAHMQGPQLELEHEQSVWRLEVSGGGRAGAGGGSYSAAVSQLPDPHGWNLLVVTFATHKFPTFVVVICTG